MRTRLLALGCLLLVAYPPAAAAAAGDGANARRSHPARDRPVPVAPVAPVADDALTQARDDGDLTAARYALERARSLFTPRPVRRRYGRVAAPRPRQATLILRDLAVRVHDLSPSAREDGRRLLARPTDGSADLGGTGYRTQASRRVCAPHVCVHWVDRTADAPPRAAADADGVPDWVQNTAAEVERAWRVEVGAYGYRAPESDERSANNGGDARLDVYLADVGADRLYGYCTTDDPDWWDFVANLSAYCVLDDDFARPQFGGPALDSLRVTAAHELFHAVQFGYDVGEDPG